MVSGNQHTESLAGKLRIRRCNSIPHPFPTPQGGSRLYRRLLPPAILGRPPAKDAAVKLKRIASELRAAESDGLLKEEENTRAVVNARGVSMDDR